mgnify:CR=1 FL=1
MLAQHDAHTVRAGVGARRGGANQSEPSVVGANFADTPKGDLAQWKLQMHASGRTTSAGAASRLGVQHQAVAPDGERRHSTRVPHVDVGHSAPKARLIWATLAASARTDARHRLDENARANVAR